MCWHFHIGVIVQIPPFQAAVGYTQYSGSNCFPEQFINSAKALFFSMTILSSKSGTALEYGFPFKRKSYSRKIQFSRVASF
jgi:hypothetical protein